VAGRDVDGDALAYTVATAPRKGRVDLDEKTGAFTYTPMADVHGDDVFTIAVSDGTATAQADVTVKVASVNDAPVSSSGSLAVDEDGQATGTLSGSDVDGDALTFAIVKGPAHGTVTLQDAKAGTFTFTPAKDFHGSDSFTFEVGDGRARSAASTMTITVAPVNDAPVITGTSLQTSEDTAVKGSVTSRDVDGDRLTHTVATAPRKGRVDLDEKTGAFTYTPMADVHGDDVFTIAVSDGTATAQADVTVKVASVNDAPVVGTEALQTAEDTALSGRLPVFDPDGDPMTVKLLTTTKLGSITLEDATTGRFRYVPQPDVWGDDRVEVEVSDGHLTVRGVVVISVASVNDAPVTVPQSIATLEDTPVEVVAEGSDIDGDRLTFEVVRQPAVGRVVVANGTRLRFEPGRDAHGEVTFEVVASDGQARSAPVTWTATVGPVNDAPTAQSLSLVTAEDVGLKGRLRFADVDGDPLQVEIVKAPIGTVTIDDAEGAFSYTPPKNFSGTDIFEYVITDPSGRSARAGVSIVVTEVDDPPVGYPAVITVSRMGVATGTLQGHDPEGRPIRFRIVSQPAIGHVTLIDDKTGKFRIETKGDRSGRVGFVFVVNDGTLDSAPAEVGVDVR
jgi:VCBS repeat-containing protein